MTKVIRTILLSLLFCAAPAGVQAHDYTAVPQEATDLRIRYDRGVATVFSEESQSTISVKIMPVAEYGDGNITLAISILNRADHEVLFDPDNVKVTLAKKNAKVTIISPAELERRARNDARWARRVGFVSGLADTAVKSTALVGQTLTSPTEAVNSVASAPGMLVDGITGKAATERTNAELEAELTTIRSQAMPKSTVEPGKVYGGLFFMKVPKLRKKDDRDMTLVITFGADEHLFPFKLDDFKP